MREIKGSPGRGTENPYARERSAGGETKLPENARNSSFFIDKNAFSPV